MALTKISRGLLSTGVSDSSDAVKTAYQTMIDSQSTP